ncbi:tRNA uridine synthase [Sesbania bispinosa]|nr:tRNA uridine synthase [Sesbania bispinosa]
MKPNLIWPQKYMKKWLPKIRKVKVVIDNRGWWFMVERGWREDWERGMKEVWVRWREGCGGK